ncbi:hypothetical protein VTL71DRAFT_7380 [Oculimacula yallundae]|uniref:FAD/NAD(P)-binding domain-containing protein n=1 Tax=Oculimacula yallundae TaxID=86028 RepID=A0ABR4BTX9_9HELO
MDEISQAFTLKEEPVENFRPLKIRIIGAGYSGIYLGVRIPQKLRNIDLQIYEKNEGVGGTWWENRYPGCACDIPAHSYQYPFEPNPLWSAFYAPALEIRHYLEGVAKKYGVHRFIKMRHQVKEHHWDDTKKRWKFSVENLATGEVMEDDADILIVASGPLNQLKWPDIKGLETFKGARMHSAAWDEVYNFEDKRIGIIGGGSSAIQIVPELQKLPGAKLSCFVRSKTWITNPFGHQAMINLGLDPNEFQFSQEFRDTLASDPAAYLQFRKEIEIQGSMFHSATLIESTMQKEARQMFQSMMETRLSKKPEIAEKLIPSFAVGCRRLTPGPGYLEALSEDNVDFITDEIDSINEQGIRLASGKEISLDVLVCATGFSVSSSSIFATGRNGATLATKTPPYVKTYLGITSQDFPNYFTMLGPNSGVGSGSLTAIIEAQGDYIVKCIRKLQKEDYATLVPKKSSVEDFSEYVGEYFKRTVFMDECRSWYKIGKGEAKRVVALWPGSTQHCIEVLRAPRWEDFDFENRDENRMRWLGNGLSTSNLPEGGDPSFFIHSQFMDTPPVERPEDDTKYKIRPFSH